MSSLRSETVVAVLCNISISEASLGQCCVSVYYGLLTKFYNVKLTQPCFVDKVSNREKRGLKRGKTVRRAEASYQKFESGF